jgi:hypothetical protein
VKRIGKLKIGRFSYAVNEGTIDGRQMGITVVKNNRRSITIDRYKHNNLGELVDTLFHELYHAFMTVMRYQNIRTEEGRAHAFGIIMAYNAAEIYKIIWGMDKWN